MLALFLFVLYNGVIKKPKPYLDVNQPFPENWRKLLDQHVRFYHELNDEEKPEFEYRIEKILAHKKITGIDVEVTDLDRLLVASSAVIPLFRFPFFNYPRLREVQLYPSSFDHEFQTHHDVKGRNILGMVGQGFLNGVVILAKPDLERSFNGQRSKSNVGIHEFIHLIDQADGAVDGIPEILFDHSYALPWLKEVKKEMHDISEGKSDINPYALTNEAEFLAVVGEYFFDNPEKMKKRHPELYAILFKIFNPTQSE